MRNVQAMGRLREVRGFETYVTNSGREMRMPVILGVKREEFDSLINGEELGAVPDGTFKEKVYKVMTQELGLILVPEKWMTRV